VAAPIAPCLWFPGNAEEAVAFYVSVFDDARVVHVDRFDDEGPKPDAPVVFIEFDLNGRRFQAINGDDRFPFSEAVSFSVECADQAEVDRYWDALTADGGQPGPCGWLKDKYGVSWQIVPTMLNDLLRSDDRVRAGRALRKMMQLGKLDVAELQAAYDA
jgi:predicted 3-demethylubiquinone-9 3-methyltransferase (glyoxalase superfamily)